MLEIPGGIRVRVRWVIVHPTSYIQINTPTDRSVIIIFCLIYVCIVFPVFVICCYAWLDMFSPIQHYSDPAGNHMPPTYMFDSWV